MRNGDWLQTATGRQFWPLDPQPEDITIYDIAHALSMQCRYGGHSILYYSVAEHCCHISDLCSPANKLWGLLHDASEAYVVDIPRPLKSFLANYKEIESRVMDCVIERFGLDSVMPDEVHEYDNRILNNEREQVMSVSPAAWQFTGARIPGLTLHCWEPDRAKREFLTRFHALRGEA